MMQQCLIDTDIGDDVDDAFGLALAAVLPSVHLCGVTTVSGPVASRASLARQLLAAAGQEPPVVPGSSTMSNGRPGSARFSHWPVLGSFPHSNRGSEPAGQYAATQLILDRSYDRAPLTIVAIGPLTNIAAALQRDPTLAQRARLVAMGGKLGLPYPDWNFRCDPPAAQRVLGSGMPITLVGMHVTMRCKMEPHQVHQVFAGRHPTTVQLARCVLAWRTWKRRIPILHDALTVAVAADATLARLVARRVRVFDSGFSIAQRGRPNALVCTTIDAARFHLLIDTYLLKMNGAARRPRLLARLLAGIA
jgi:purine nucleosidase